MADASNGGLWASIQPWVQGLALPSIPALWVAFKWWRSERRRETEDENDYRLRDRAQIAADTEAALNRSRREIADVEARCTACEAERDAALAAFYDLYEWGRNNRHDLNGELARAFLAWQAGKQAPEKMPFAPELPPKSAFLK